MTIEKLNQIQAAKDRMEKCKSIADQFRGKAFSFSVSANGFGVYQVLTDNQMETLKVIVLSLLESAEKEAIEAFESL